MFHGVGVTDVLIFKFNIQRSGGQLRNMLALVQT